MITPIYTLCDVSKTTLDICIIGGDTPRFHAYPNTDKGHADLLAGGWGQPSPVAECSGFRI